MCQMLHVFDFTIVAGVFLFYGRVCTSVLSVRSSFCPFKKDHNDIFTINTVIFHFRFLLAVTQENTISKTVFMN